MTATESASVGDATDQHDSDIHVPHGDLLYWKVGGFLALVTALEVSTYWWPERTLTSAALITMMVVKFVVVAMFFMHLKDDARILSQLFAAGIVIALAIYVSYLGAMLIFDNGGNGLYEDPPRDREVPEVVVEQSAIPDW